MKRTKALLALLLALVMVCTALPLAAAEDVTIVDSGTCGGTWNSETQNFDSLTWQFDSEGSLIISGYGSMTDYGASASSSPDGSFEYSNHAPWGQYNTQIKAVIINEGVTSIGRCNFYGCINLENVLISESVTDIGGAAFANCISLKRIYISDNVKRIDVEAFLNCLSLDSIQVSENNNYYYSDDYGVLFTKNNSTLVQYPLGSNHIDYEIPVGVEKIERQSFYNCQYLKGIKIPDTVSIIENRAFYRDSFRGDLPTAVLFCNKNSYTASWAESNNYPYAFLDGTEEDNTISETVNAKLSYTIDRRTRTLSVNNQGKLISFASYNAPWRKYQQYIITAILSEGCTSISAKAFYACNNLKCVVLPNTIETIDESAFENCYSLKEIVIPDSVTTIGARAFYSCSSLETINLPDSVVSLGSPGIMYDYGDYSVDPGIFAFCTSLKTVSIGNGVTAIMGGMFHECIQLKSVYMGNGIETIGHAAFLGCSNLTTISFSHQLKYIDGIAFYGCSSISSFDLPVSVEYIGNRTFSDNSLRDITIRNANCVISQDAISIYATVHGYAGSTAEQFADEYGYFFEEIEPHDHEYESHIKGLCTEPHDVIYTCKYCNDSYTEHEGATEHVYGEPVRGTSCGGVIDTYTCTRCGYSYQDVITEPNHDFVEIKRTEPNCGNNGSVVYQCRNCGTLKEEILPAQGEHEFLIGKIYQISPSQHTVYTYCKNCGYGKEETAAHTFGDWKEQSPTCETGGQRERICGDCGYCDRILLPATGHSYGAWRTLIAATPEATGIEICFCATCGAHNFREVAYDGSVVTPQQPDRLVKLREIYNQIPPKSQWDQFIDTSKLTGPYDAATDILQNPKNYSQTVIDITATNLKNEWDSIRYHTTSIQLDKTSASGAVGETVTLTATLQPTKAGDPVEWISNAPDIVSVTASGENNTVATVTILKYFDQAVTITAISNKKNASCTLQITQPAPEDPGNTDQPQDEEPQGFFQKIGAFFRNLFDKIFGIFRR